MSRERSSHGCGWNKNCFLIKNNTYHSSNARFLPSRFCPMFDYNFIFFFLLQFYMRKFILINSFK